MPVASVGLKSMSLPEFGEPTVMPLIARSLHETRIEALMALAAAAGLDGVVVYGDREHAANVAYLSGYDPRFEETLLIVVPQRQPTLLVGNEGWGYAEICDGPYQRVLYQTFSLPAQPRDRSDALPDILAESGLRPGQRIGAIGWKPFGAGDAGFGEMTLDLPSFIADTLRALVGDKGAVVNAANLLMNPADGLRAINEADQLAAFEFAATFSSQGLRNVLQGIEPGMTELQAARLMGMNGLPLGCHPMLSAGRRAPYGLPSPRLDVISRGAPITMAYGIQGALNARAGFLAEDASELPPAIRDYVEKLVAPYFSAVVDWYEAIGIGTTGGTLWKAVHDRIGDPFFGVSLNPGHLVHIDEWMHSPVFCGSDIKLRSGMALQVDIIPATGGDYFTTNIEDGIALADDGLREEIAARYPEAWRRIQARRAFMGDVLGIRLKPEVLPFSNIPAFLPPFWLSRNSAMAVIGR
ncbi:aminopeptidase P family N-terminal domain-containing protein [Mesorhizobium sp. ES1-1]|uniref:aminopeptidase P family N-terminal domain-containing protein n=1 Tax=Mesorhizobium sp. ES1-1 TaxID=2876629 RepID=UPI001CCCC49D|nr:aminopeptidase P family N-terminal domain-containing protein [Mesorhizobium sp. ES1-1]MBZ9676893.1 aminopeptidase P family N-terminal domain-containing protein [Mesorhizobium sp. ES1-1]